MPWVCDTISIHLWLERFLGHLYKYNFYVRKWRTFESKYSSIHGFYLGNVSFES